MKREREILKLNGKHDPLDAIHLFKKAIRYIYMPNIKENPSHIPGMLQLGHT